MGGVPVAVVAVAAVVAVGVVEIGRTVYYAFRRRRLFRQVAAAESGPAPMSSWPAPATPSS